MSKQEYYIETTEQGGFIWEAVSDSEIFTKLSEYSEQNPNDRVILFYNINLKEEKS